MASRKVLIGGGAVVTGILAAPYFGISLPNPFITPAVRSVEERYMARGGSPNSTGMAPKLGNPDQPNGGADTPNKTKGVGTPYWDENFADQKSPPGAFKKNWNEAHYGSEKGR